MSRSALEPILGALVLIVAAGFLYFAYAQATHRGGGGYPVNARFSAIDGLAPGADVRVSGVKVGTVASIGLDPKTFLAQVTLDLRSDVRLPTDTVASVTSEGLLGGKFVSLEPGSSDDVIKPGGRIDRTQASASIDKLLGQVIFNLQNLGKPQGQGGGNGG